MSKARTAYLFVTLALTVVLGVQAGTSVSRRRVTKRPRSGSGCGIPLRGFSIRR
jgi:hypothetical protein